MVMRLWRSGAKTVLSMFLYGPYAICWKLILTVNDAESTAILFYQKK